MKKQGQIRSVWLNFRVSESEKNEIEKLYRQTTCNSLREYVRDVLLKKPVTFYFRDPIADDYLKQLIQLREEVKTIGIKLNQDVHELHSLDSIGQIKSWSIRFEPTKKLLSKKLDEINEKCDEIVQVYKINRQPKG